MTAIRVTVTHFAGDVDGGGVVAIVAAGKDVGGGTTEIGKSSLPDNRYDVQDIEDTSLIAHAAMVAVRVTFGRVGDCVVVESVVL